MVTYVTGDKHGDYDTALRNTLKSYNTTKDDTLIVLGDHGINYLFPDHRTNHKVSKLPIKLFCISGNHDRRPTWEGTDSTYKEIEYFNAKAYYEPKYPDIIYAKFGEIYTIDNKKVVNLDGAYSVDKHIRLYHYSMGHFGYKWFSSEQPTDEMKNYAIWNLAKNNWKVDYVLSHTCPYDLIPREMFLSGLNNDKDVDQSMEYWLQYIYNNITFDKWYTGHWHTSRNLNDKVVCLYHQVIKLGDMVEDDYLDGVNS